MSVAHHPFAFENYHIFRLGLTKNTFNMSLLYLNSTTKLKRISETNNTLQGIVRVDYKKTPLAHCKR